MRISGVALALALSTVAGPSASTASMCLPPEARPNSVPHYVAALVDALAYGKSGRDRTANTEVIAELMLNLKLKDGDYECAASQLAPYEKSQNKAVSISAQLARTAFLSLVALDRRMVGLLRDLLDRGPNDPRFGSVSEQVAQIGVEADDAWKLLPMAAAGATQALADPEALGQLVVTAQDRARLLAKLDDTFGKGIHGGLKAGQFALDAAAAALYGFLGDQQWKSRPGGPAAGFDAVTAEPTWGLYGRARLPTTQPRRRSAAWIR